MLSVKFIETNGLLEFLQDIRPYGCHEGGAWIYRGQTDTSWELKPKAGREDYFNWMLEGEMAPASDGAPPSKRPKIDLERFWAWRALAVAYDGKLPENEFECLAYAQHYGLATRLLDWTTNPLVALYFAVEAQQDRHGAVW